MIIRTIKKITESDTHMFRFGVQLLQDNRMLDTFWYKTEGQRIEVMEIISKHTDAVFNNLWMNNPNGIIRAHNVVDILSTTLEGGFLFGECTIGNANCPHCYLCNAMMMRSGLLTCRGCGLTMEDEVEIKDDTYSPENRTMDILRNED